LKSWITFRTCDSSLSGMRAISDALINMFEAGRVSVAASSTRALSASRALQPLTLMRSQLTHE
jgi:hypothetical protein